MSRILSVWKPGKESLMRKFTGGIVLLAVRAIEFAETASDDDGSALINLNTGLSCKSML